MSYSSPSAVAALCKNILSGQTTFTTSSCPTSTEVNQWLSSGCAIIESTLAGCKYSVPVTAGTTAYDWLGQLNALYAAAYVEWSRTNVTLAPGERTRGDRFLESFWSQLDRLCDGDMTLAGLTRTSQGTLYAGGTKRDEKQTWEQDTNRVNPRWARGMFRPSGVIDPTATTAS